MQLFLSLFVMLYTILPPFFVVFGWGSSNFLAVIFCVVAFVYLIFQRKIHIHGKDTLFIVVVSLLLLISYFVHGEYFYYSVLISSRILIIYFISLLVNTREKVERVLDLLLIVGFVMCILGAVEFVTNWNPFALIQNTTATRYSASAEYIRMGVERVTLSFGHAITAAIYFSFLSLISLYKMMVSTKKRNYQVMYIFTNLLTIMTLSRWPILVSIVIQFIAWIKVKRIYGIRLKPKHLIGMFTALLIITMLICGVGEKIFNNIYIFISSIFGTTNASAFGGNTNPLAYRLALFSAILNSAKSTAFTGIGINAMKNLKFSVPEFGAGLYYSIDNHYLQYYYMLGICGLTASILMFVYLIKTCADQLKKIGKANRNYFWFYTIMVLLVAEYMINLVSVSQSYEYEIFCILAGLILARRKCKLN